MSGYNENDVKAVRGYLKNVLTSVIGTTEKNEKHDKGILTTIQRQSYMQHDLILRIQYAKYIAMFTMVFLISTIVLLIVYNNITPNPIIGLLFVVILCAYIMTIVFLVMSRRRRRSYRFTTRRFTQLEKDSTSDEKCVS